MNVVRHKHDDNDTNDVSIVFDTSYDIIKTTDDSSDVKHAVKMPTSTSATTTVVERNGEVVTTEETTEIHRGEKLVTVTEEFVRVDSDASQISSANRKSILELTDIKFEDSLDNINYARIGISGETAKDSVEFVDTTAL